MDYNDVFYSEATQRSGFAGQSFQGFPKGVVDGCIWIDGKHAYCENPECPEVNRSELGDNKPIGWTVQQI